MLSRTVTINLHFVETEKKILENLISLEFRSYILQIYIDYSIDELPRGKQIQNTQTTFKQTFIEMTMQNF